jgi:tetratricopeptide (TPR) repeat protein
VEAYLEQYGWVPFDPTFADRPNARSTFENLSRMYIYKTWKRVDPYLGSYALKYEYKWEYVGELKSTSEYNRSWEKTYQMGSVYKHYNNHDYDSALSVLNELIIFDSKNTDYLTFKGMIFARMGHIEEGRALFQLGLRNSVHDYQKMNTYYSYANFLSLTGDVENSYKYLRGSLDLGFRNFDHIMKDEDLGRLRETEGFQELIDLYKE